jgi:hypothetical protein
MTKAANTPNLVKRVLQEGGEILDKKHLSERLNWSRTRLDRRLKRDQNFPVLQCGNRGCGWRFDAGAVERHLATTSAQSSTDVAGNLSVEFPYANAYQVVVEALVWLAPPLRMPEPPPDISGGDHG